MNKIADCQQKNFLLSLIQIKVQFILNDPINKATLVPVMSWCRVGETPCAEPKMPKFSNAVWKPQLLLS